MTNKVSLSPYQSIGIPELQALERVVKSGTLSGFYGSWGDEFLGGPEIKNFEDEWSQKFSVKHSVTVNSNTSGLYCALAAIGLSPGDEVIVSPFSMSASAIAPVLYGGIPVFADIDESTFCISIESVQSLITSKTKAVIVVNIFGHPGPLSQLRDICNKHNIYLIEDNAQAPLAKENGKWCGTIGDIGVFSLNYHKHIHCGEGGLCVTDNDDLAFRMQAVRNHSENIVQHEHLNLSPVNMVGFNFRMTEMSAAIGRVQLQKIDSEVSKRIKIAEILSHSVKGLEGLSAPHVRENCSHSYYLWGLKVNAKELGVSRSVFAEALTQYGFPNFLGYTKPLYKLPLFQERIAIGDSGWPFVLSEIDYQRVFCPTAERMYNEELICFETCMYDINEQKAQELGSIIKEVHLSRGSI